MTSLIPSIPCFFIFEITLKTLTNNSLAEPAVWEECTSNFTGWPKSLKKAYFPAVFLIIFVIPLAIMFCLYTHILLQLREKARDNKRARLLEMGEQNQVKSIITKCVHTTLGGHPDPPTVSYSGGHKTDPPQQRALTTGSSYGISLGKFYNKKCVY